MSLAQKFLTGLFGIAMVTTLILPGRQTPKVMDAARKMISYPLGTAMGQNKG